MGCPALGIWVGFLKQPALPGEAPQNKNYEKKNYEKKKIHKWIKSSSKIYIYFLFFLGARPGSASGCFKKATQIPKAWHPIPKYTNKITKNTNKIPKNTNKISKNTQKYQRNSQKFPKILVYV
jgi:hypothetical protein